MSLRLDLPLDEIDKLYDETFGFIWEDRNVLEEIEKIRNMSDEEFDACISKLKEAENSI